MKKIFFTFFLILISFPLLVNGQGIVPCGPGTTDPVCKFCHIFVLFKNVVDFFLFTIVPPLAVIMAAIGGMFFFFSAGDPEKVTKGKNILTNLVFGLVIIYSAWLIVGFFLLMIGAAELSGTWYEINCP
jgi:hypothetical protein